MRVRFLSVALLTCFMAAPSLQAADEGIEYFRLGTPVPTAHKNKVEVLEAFSYGCPHCAHFEPIVSAWKKNLPTNTEFVRFHVIFEGNPGWELLARTYYAAEVMGVVEKIHKPLFAAIHEQNRDVSSEQKIAEIVAEQGVDKKQFLDTLHSFAVDTKMRRARDLTQRYGIDGVPTMIVNGKFRTSARYAGGEEAMLKLVDDLVLQELKK
ncbi:MAG: thiol:disulfide interchange protein DsbA/DsbL [Gammaproteobacteria bacterium]|nr:thiol:disulfide interchange protein DsbA/DsbL [Gammaproteobacteria bacterium]